MKFISHLSAIYPRFRGFERQLALWYWQNIPTASIWWLLWLPKFRIDHGECIAAHTTLSKASHGSPVFWWWGKWSPKRSTDPPGFLSAHLVRGTEHCQLRGLEKKSPGLGDGVREYEGFGHYRSHLTFLSDRVKRAPPMQTSQCFPVDSLHVGECTAPFSKATLSTSYRSCARQGIKQKENLKTKLD